MASRDDGARGPAVASVDDRADLRPALQALGLLGPRPVLVSVGGAGGMSDPDLELMRGLLRDHVLPLLADRGAIVVDGGTDSGVMRVMGQEVAAAGLAVPLLGVAAAGTVRLPGGPTGDDTAALEPNHTAVVIVPGRRWGDESPWVGAVAEAVGGPSATLLVNGGEIAYQDVRYSVDAERPVVVVAGTGRTADRLAGALRGVDVDPQATELARSGCLRAVDVADGVGLVEVLSGLLAD